MMFSISAFAQTPAAEFNAKTTEDTANEADVKGPATPTYKIEIGEFSETTDIFGNFAIALPIRVYGFGYGSAVSIDGKTITKSLNSYALYSGNTVIGNCYVSNCVPLSGGYHVVEAWSGNGVTAKKTIKY